MNRCRVSGARRPVRAPLDCLVILAVAGCLVGQPWIAGAQNSPRVIAEPAQVKPGSSTTLQISGFAPFAGLTILLDGTRISYATEYTDKSGNEVKQVVIPTTLALGPHRVVVTDQYGHQASITITIQNGASAPTLQLDPSAGPPGQMVAITGDNWDRRQHSVILRDSGGRSQNLAASDPCLFNGPPVGPGDARDCGKPLYLLAQIPEQAAAGQYLFTVSDGFASASAAFRVLGPRPAPTTAIIVLQPASGRVNSTVVISGSGFAQSARVITQWDANGGGQLSIATDVRGGFTGYQVHVPAVAAAGPHRITATDGLGHIATGTFTVLPGPAYPQPRPCNPHVPRYSQPGCVDSPAPNPPPTQGKPCNPHMPRYSQPGCVDSPAPDPPPTQGKPCNPNVPRYSQPGCVSDK